MSWRATKWGALCVELGDFVNEVYPEFKVCIGPDEISAHDAAPRITFAVPQDQQLTSPRRGGDLETHPTFDGEQPVQVEIWTRDELDPYTNYDNSPVTLEAVVERFLEGLDAVQYERYGRPSRIAWRGGKIGEYGSKAIIPIVVSVFYHRTPATMAMAIKTSVTIEVETPDGNGAQIVETVEVVGGTP